MNNQADTIQDSKITPKNFSDKVNEFLEQYKTKIMPAISIDSMTRYDTIDNFMGLLNNFISKNSKIIKEKDGYIFQLITMGNLEMFGKNVIKDFELKENSKWIYQLFIDYFLKIERKEYDLKKGILLVGDIGIGKTVLMKLFSNAVYEHDDMGQYYNCNYFIMSTRHITRDFSLEGAIVLNRYGKGTSQRYCFDDLGLEDPNSNIYGNKANVMAEILLDRYERGTITHATSNLSIKSLENIYGERLRDRFKEMFNLITLTGKSLRK